MASPKGLSLVFALLAICSAQRSYPLAQSFHCWPDSEIPLTNIVPLPCNVAAGTIKLKDDAYPNFSCNTSIYLDFDTRPHECANLSPANYSIYFNVKAINLRTDDTVEFYENDVHVKTIDWSPQSSALTTAHHITSHGQLLSGFAQVPSFSLRFHKASGDNSSVQFNSLVLDYTIIRDKKSSEHDIKCKALSGYISDRLFCETGDRVNCPSEYVPTMDMDPVQMTELHQPDYPIPARCHAIWKEFQTTKPPVFSTTRPVTSPWHPVISTHKPDCEHGSCSNRLGVAEIVGIVMACVVVSIFVSVLVFRIWVGKKMEKAAGLQSTHQYGAGNHTIVPPGFAGQYPDQAAVPPPRTHGSYTVRPIILIAKPVMTRNEQFPGAPPAYSAIYPEAKESYS